MTEQIAQEVPFEEDEIPVYRVPTEETREGMLVVTLDAYEGPLDLLLDLARDQKVDLVHISILRLVEQYVAFIEEAKKIEIVVAADYLLMASWLTFLKSKLLLPQDEENEEEPSGQMLADALTYQLKRLESIRNVADLVFDLPRLGIDFFALGKPEGLITSRYTIYDVSVLDLMKAYGDIHRRKTHSSYKPEAYRLLSLDEALERLEQMLGKIDRGLWLNLFSLMPREDVEIDNRLYKKSRIASTFIAGLEMGKRGAVFLKQEKPFDNIFVQRREEESM